MKYSKYVAFFILIFALTSCYHAQITTDKQPSNNVIEKPWAHSFVFGLVPPSEVATASECPNGVAKVETKISFLNGLVSGITFNLYTPMHITVTCAAGSGMSAVEEDSEEKVTVSKKSDKEKVIDAIHQASIKAAKTDKPVFVKFR